MYLVQLTVDMVAALDHAEKVEGLSRHLRRDTGLVIKTLLTGTFAGPVLRPWRLHGVHGRAALVIGYAGEDAEALRGRLALALPSAQTAVGEIVTAPVPTLDGHAELAFEVRFSPVVSVNREGGGIIRRDAFLRAKELASARGEEAPTRDDVYRAYLATRLPGLELVSAALTGHRLERHAREGGGRWTIKSVPVAEMHGLVRITDAPLAQRTIREGVGRSKAYGCGMIRLAPASAARVAA
jgi:CRISPR-associated protein Cas6/Cse3/CasE subtype I-E